MQLSHCLNGTGNQMRYNIAPGQSPHTLKNILALQKHTTVGKYLALERVKALTFKTSARCLRKHAHNSAPK